MLLARWTNGPHMKRARPAHAARMQRALDAQPANGSGQMTVPIKSVSCFPSYRSREETRHTREIQNANQERQINAMSVNSKKTPAVAGGRGHGGRGRGGRGRSKELPILHHAAVAEDVVETPTRAPSSSPQVSPTRSRSGSGESRVDLMLASQASTAFKRRKDKKDNKLADDEYELMVAFLEANKMLWDKKATQYRIPDLKNAAWQKPADTMEKEVAHLQGLRACHTNSQAWTSCPSPGLIPYRRCLPI